MNRIFASLAGFWITALLIPSSVAQTKLDRKTSIDVTAVAPGDVYRSLARTLGCELVVAPEVRQNVTLHLENVTVRTALTALSESVGGQWSMEGNTLRVVPAGSARPGGVTGGVPGGVKGGVIGGVPGGVSGGLVGGVPGGRSGSVDFKQRLERKTPDNFHFENTPLHKVMDALGKVADLEVQVEEPAATQRVTLDLSNRTIMAAFKTIREQAGMEKAIVLVATIPGSEKKMHLKMGPPKNDE